MTRAGLWRAPGGGPGAIQKPQGKSHEDEVSDEEHAAMKASSCQMQPRGAAQRKQVCPASRDSSSP